MFWKPFQQLDTINENYRLSTSLYNIFCVLWRSIVIRFLLLLSIEVFTFACNCTANKNIKTILLTTKLNKNCNCSKYITRPFHFFAGGGEGLWKRSREWDADTKTIRANSQASGPISQSPRPCPNMSRNDWRPVFQSSARHHGRPRRSLPRWRRLVPPGGVLTCRRRRLLRTAGVRPSSRLCRRGTGCAGLGHRTSWRRSCTCLAPSGCSSTGSCGACSTGDSSPPETHLQTTRDVTSLRLFFYLWIIHNCDWKSSNKRIVIVFFLNVIMLYSVMIHASVCT